MSQALFELILAIKRKCQSIEEGIRKDMGITHAEFNALLVLNPGEQINGNELADRMVLSPSRSSRVLSNLMNHGYVTSQFQPDDRRSVQIDLTEKGKKAKAEIIKRMQKCERRFSSGLNDAQMAEIRNSLQLLLDVL